MIYFYAILVGFFFKNLCIIKNKIGFWLLITFIGLITFLYISVDIITDEGFNRAFWYHINNDLFSGSYKPYLGIFLFNLIVFCISFFLGFITRSKFSFSRLNFFSNYHLSLIVLIIIINPGILSLTKSFINTSITNAKIENLDFKSYFNQINNLPDKFENKDLIFITAESLERTFYTNPELKRLKLSLISRNDIHDFSNIIEANEYTSWTIAGIVANNCGIPIIDSRFYSGFNCLSDLLAKKNYDLFSIQGSSENFAGNGNFYKIHNIKNVIGFDQIIKENKGAEKSKWGVYDNFLLNYSKNKILNLEKKNKPFAIWINTLDTHPPHGLLSLDCKQKASHIQSSLLKTVYCTDQYLNSFIDDLISADDEQNNLYIIVSDHLLNPSPVSRTFFKDKKKRRNLFLIIDPYIKKKVIINTPGNQLDIPATIIDYLKGGKQIGLGSSLLDKEKNKSLSSKNIKLENILFSFENNLREINSKIDFKKVILKEDELTLKFNTGLESQFPIFFINDKVYTPETDISGFSKDSFDNKIYEFLILNKKRNSLEIIARCNSINLIFQDQKINCNFAYLKFLEIQGHYLISIKMFKNDINNYFKIMDEKKIIKINKNEFLKKVKKFSNNKKNISPIWNNFRSIIKNNLSTNYPQTYSFIAKKYLSCKSIFEKIRFNIFKNQSQISSNFLKKNDTFIAHGGGKIDKNLKTNSLEALELNYEKGIKYFELDLNLTSDGKIVAVHDWLSWKDKSGFTGKIPPTSNEFLQIKINQKYTPLDEEKIVKWFIKNKDAFLVTDKLDNLNLILNKFKKIDQRLLIELFTEKSIDSALKLNFENILITQRILWRNNYSIEYLNSLANRSVSPHGFSVSREAIYNNYKFFEHAKKLGFKIYVYGVNEDKFSTNEQYLLCNLHYYIDGVYADNLPNIPETLNKSSYCNY